MWFSNYVIYKEKIRPNCRTTEDKTNRLYSYRHRQTLIDSRIVLASDVELQVFTVNAVRTDSQCCVWTCI